MISLLNDLGIKIGSLATPSLVDVSDSSLTFYFPKVNDLLEFRENPFTDIVASFYIIERQCHRDDKLTMCESRFEYDSFVGGLSVLIDSKSSTKRYRKMDFYTQLTDGSPELTIACTPSRPCREVPESVDFFDLFIEIENIIGRAVEVNGSISGSIFEDIAFEIPPFAERLITGLNYSGEDCYCEDVDSSVGEFLPECKITNLASLQGECSSSFTPYKFAKLFCDEDEENEFPDLPQPVLPPVPVLVPVTEYTPVELEGVQEAVVTHVFHDPSDTALVIEKMANNEIFMVQSPSSYGVPIFVGDGIPSVNVVIQYTVNLFAGVVSCSSGFQPDSYEFSYAAEYRASPIGDPFEGFSTTSVVTGCRLRSFGSHVVDFTLGRKYVEYNFCVPVDEFVDPKMLLSTFLNGQLVSTTEFFDPDSMDADCLPATSTVSSRPNLVIAVVAIILAVVVVSAVVAAIVFTATASGTGIAASVITKAGPAVVSSAPGTAKVIVQPSAAWVARQAAIKKGVSVGVTGSF
jgi:hypothetical protein